MPDIFVADQKAGFAELDAVYQRLESQIAVDEGGNCSNCIQAKPEEKVFRAVSTVDSNNFVLVNAQVVREPISNSLEVCEEVLVRPCSAFKDEEDSIRVLAGGLVFKDMVC